MNRKIGIVHRSEIIKKGLTAIIKNFFNVEVFQFAQIKELKDYPEIQNSLRILFIESESLSDLVLFNKLKNNSEIKTIGIISNSEAKKSDFQFDSEINTLESSHKIQEIISGFLQSGSSESTEQEGDELTQREKDVLKLVALGYSNKDIAEELFISIHTVISHRKNTTEKLGIKSISGLTVYAILTKLINTDNLNPENLI
jgi:DNA-binding CsgD family transcriptional regulator